MERYKVTIDGVEYKKNVSPDNKEKFFEKYKNNNPVLIVETDKSSKKTGPSEDNQQTRFNIHDLQSVKEFDTGSKDAKTYNVKIGDKIYSKKVSLSKEQEFIDKYGDHAQIVGDPSIKWADPQFGTNVIGEKKSWGE